MMEEEKNTALMAEEMPMEEEAMPAEAEMAPEEEMPMEEEAEGPDMEMLMGNFLDLPDKDRKIAQAVILGAPAGVLDAILGAPTFTRMQTQLKESMAGGGAPEAPTEEMPAEEPAGIMAETEAPMAEDEEMM